MKSQDAYAQLVQRAAALLQRGEFSEAEKASQEILAKFGVEANALMFLGLIRLEHDDPVAAVGFLERARQVNPSHIHVLTNLGNAYRAVGRLIDARDAYESALRIDKSFAVAYNNLGNVLIELGDRLAAARAYERAVALQPNYVDPVANLARLAEEAHQLDEALALSDRAIALGPLHFQGRLTHARVLQRNGILQQAADELQALLLDDSATSTNKIVCLGYLGETFEKLNRLDDAFAAFSKANELQLKLHKKDFDLAQSYVSPASVRRLTQFVASEDVSQWRAGTHVDRDPVFLLGFPRSGTTLLDQILASHPEVTTLEERELLLDACHILLAPEGGLERWKNLSESEISRLREGYWQKVRSNLGQNAVKRVFVDKLPLNAALLPVIYRLFPRAKIVFAVRDPRDVIVSCFQQRFGMNAAMYQLLKIETAVSYYDEVMSLSRLCRQRMALNVHDIKYESVISSFDKTVSDVLVFLDLPWDDRVRNYSATARSRAIGTPSATQVVQPLYKTSHGKWRGYRAFLQPYLPALAPWVAALGYDSD